MTRTGSEAGEVAALKRELKDLLDDFQQMPSPRATKDERLQNLHDAWIMYTDDVVSAMLELLKGTRPLFNLRHYIGIRRNKRIERLISKLQRLELPSDLEKVVNDYQKQYAHAMRMVDLAVTFLRAQKRGL